MLAWLRCHCDSAPPKPSTSCRSLVKVGYSQQHYGVPGTPKFRSGMKVLEVLWEYFHTSKGASQNMNRKWRVHRSELGGA